MSDNYGFTMVNLRDRLASLAERLASYPDDDLVPRLIVDPLCEIERWADKHGNDEHNRSCIDRIDRHFESRLEDIKAMMFWLHAWEQSDKEAASGHYDEAVRRLEEYPLSAERGHIALSWGGPADGFRYTTDEDHVIEDVSYYLQDWWDGAKMDVDQRNYPEIWAFIENFAEYLGE
jgi:hypothetical protein